MLTMLRQGPLSAVSLCCAVAVAVAQDGWRVAGRAAVEDGPCVLVVGLDSTRGPAGARAARQVSRWRPRAGRLAAAWPACRNARPEGEPLPDRTAVAASAAADVVVFLDEDVDFAAEIRGAHGATVWSSAGLEASARVAARLRALEGEKSGHWRPAAEPPFALPSSPSPSASPPPAAAGAIETWVVTTCSKHERKLQRRHARIREHRHAVAAIADAHGLLDAGRWVERLAPAGEPDVLRLAVFDGAGAVSTSGHGPPWLAATLAREPDLRVELIGPEEIAAGALADFDAVVFGGGSARAQGQSLGADGRAAVRAFVAGGGGFVGICAGAFLACTDSERDLALIDLEASGTAGSRVVDLVFARGGPWSSPGRHRAKFSNGPLLVAGDGARLPPARIVARYAEDEPRLDGELERLRGTPAVAVARFRDGRVVVFGPHCERAPGPRAAFLAGLRFAARRR